uniref:Uncharacterized protein n=1 Tax=Fagus sylvatica TaxID=28930 RepID=A0A2N9HHB0_FAGSY
MGHEAALVDSPMRRTRRARKGRTRGGVLEDCSWIYVKVACDVEGNEDTLHRMIAGACLHSGRGLELAHLNALDLEPHNLIHRELAPRVESVIETIRYKCTQS